MGLSMYQDSISSGVLLQASKGNFSEWYRQLPLRRTHSGPAPTVRLKEVSALVGDEVNDCCTERTNFMCLLQRGVRFNKVSVKRDLTVLTSSLKLSCMQWWYEYVPSTVTIIPPVAVDHNLSSISSSNIPENILLQVRYIFLKKHLTKHIRTSRARNSSMRICEAGF